MKNMAVIFKALGDENRLKIVEMLLGKELCVCDILAAFDKSQPVISHHLKILKYAGIVSDVREGKFIYYSLNQNVFEVLSAYIGHMQETSRTKERVHPCI